MPKLIINHRNFSELASLSPELSEAISHLDLVLYELIKYLSSETEPDLDFITTSIRSDYDGNVRSATEAPNHNSPGGAIDIIPIALERVNLVNRLVALRKEGNESTVMKGIILTLRSMGFNSLRINIENGHVHMDANGDGLIHIMSDESSQDRVYGDIGYKIETMKSFAGLTLPSRKRFKRKNPPVRIIMHTTAGENIMSALNWFASRSPESKNTAAHYVIGYTAEEIKKMNKNHDSSPLLPHIIQVAHPDIMLAHVGPNAMNQTDIGIEMARVLFKSPLSRIDKAIIDASVWLTKKLVSKYHIKPEHILRHSDVQPGRKIDPGPAYPINGVRSSIVGDISSIYNIDDLMLETDVIVRGLMSGKDKLIDIHDIFIKDKLSLLSYINKATGSYVSHADLIKLASMSNLIRDLLLNAHFESGNTFPSLAINVLDNENHPLGPLQMRKTFIDDFLINKNNHTSTLISFDGDEQRWDKIRYSLATLSKEVYDKLITIKDIKPIDIQSMSQRGLMNYAFQQSVIWQLYDASNFAMNRLLKNAPVNYNRALFDIVQIANSLVGRYAKAKGQEFSKLESLRIIALIIKKIVYMIGDPKLILNREYIINKFNYNRFIMLSQKLK